MKKRVVIPLVIVAVLVVVFLILSIPTPKELEIQPNPLNTQLYNTLSELGIEDAVVDVTADRTVVRYNLPENMSKEDAEISIMQVAAEISINSGKIIIQTYENFKPVEEVIVGTNDVLAFMEKTITYEEFRKRIEV